MPPSGSGNDPDEGVVDRDHCSEDAGAVPGRKIGDYRDVEFGGAGRASAGWQH
jgi:hypothetical protein